MTRRATFAPSSKPAAPDRPSARPLDPIARAALRYTVSPREYALLHHYLLSRSAVVSERVPRPRTYAADVAAAGGDYNATALRTSLRLFAASLAAFKVVDWLSDTVARLKQARSTGSVRLASLARPTVGWKKSQVRLSAAVGLILLFHRLLYRFFFRLRKSLLLPSASPFVSRNPRVGRFLTSRYIPPVGASIAGAFLALCPATQLRITVTVYALSRAVEFLFNALEMDGLFVDAPSWFGSWLLVPASCAQLLHALVFDPESVPSAVSRAVAMFGGPYLQPRAQAVAVSGLALGPSDGFANVHDGTAKPGFPTWNSSSVVPFLNVPTVPPVSLIRLRPSTASTDMRSGLLSCARLHPDDPSCRKTYLKFYAAELPRISKLMAAAIGSVSLLSRSSELAKSPLATTANIASTIARASMALTGGMATAWGSLCLFNSTLPQAVLPRARVYVAGFLAGMWAYLLHTPHPRGRILHPSGGLGASLVKPASAVAAAASLESRISGSRSNFLSLFRYAVTSTWEQARERSRWTRSGQAGALPIGAPSSPIRIVLFLLRRPVDLVRTIGLLVKRNVDVAVFVLSLAVIQAVYVARPAAIQGRTIRWACSWIIGEQGERCEVVDRAVDRERMRESRAGELDGIREEREEDDDKTKSK